jgi:hypothetical protein
VATVATREEKKPLSNEKKKETYLTPTGLLMEGHFAKNPRFTRNSDRPRASDRTMVDTEDTRTRLPSFQTRLASSPSADEPHGWQTSQNKTSRANRGAHLQQWAESRDQTFSPSGRGGAFFLTFLFIELVEVDK